MDAANRPAEPALKILLVDDDPDDRALVRRTLTKGLPGCEVREAHAEDSLRRELASFVPDAVVTDYRLRWTTGLDVAAVVRAACSGAAVLMYTGTGDEGVAVAAMKAGLDDYVVKSPVHLRRLPGALVSAVERIRARAALEARTRELRHADRMSTLGRATGGVAHDFNNLLTVVFAGVDEALADPELRPETRRALEAVRAAADRGASLSRRLLSFGSARLRPTAVVDLNHVLRDAADFVRRLVDEDVEFRFEPREGALPVAADSLQIEQILVNLAVNARDAMPRGGRLVVSTGRSADVRGNWAEFAVSDTGPGIPAAVLGRLYEPFVTTKPEGVGTGLGLSVVKGLVDELGGRISVDTKAGVGTTFVVRLPAADASLPIRATETRPPAGGALVGRGPALVVDDDPAVRALIAAAVASAGYRVFEAAGGAEGRRALQDAGGRFALIVSDVSLGAGAGPDAVRELGAADGVPTLFVSGYADAAAWNAVRAFPRRAFLPKPFNRATLLGAIAALLADQPRQEPQGSGASATGGAGAAGTSST
jgi:two-component system cell cycle sensor histidine kinase/response regulator CckA